MLQSFTKILFSLVWWQVWNIDSYHVLTKDSLWWNMSDYHRSKNIGQVFGMSLHWNDANIIITQVVIMMTPCRDHIDDKLGITTIFDFRYYSWSSEHQDYDCNSLPLTGISWKWISFVLLCFKYTSSGDRRCKTLGESLWTTNQFLVSNESQVCELCVSMFRNKWYWFIQIHLDKPYFAAIEPESNQWCKLDAAPFWHIMAYLRGCNIL